MGTHGEGMVQVTPPKLQHGLLGGHVAARFQYQPEGGDSGGCIRSAQATKEGKLQIVPLVGRGGLRRPQLALRLWVDFRPLESMETHEIS